MQGDPVRIQVPIRGAANNTAAFDTPAVVCPPSAIDNVLPIRPDTDRPQIGSRMGFPEFFPGQYGSGLPVQGMGVVHRGRTASGYTLGVCTALATTSGGPKDSPPIAGQVWGLVNQFFLTLAKYEDVTGDGGPANQSVNAVCASPDGTRIVHACNYVDASTDQVSRITCRDSTTGAVLWTQKIATAGVDRFTNSVVCNGEWVFACTNAMVRVYRLSSGAAPAVGAQDFAMNGWSDECIRACLDTSGRLLVAFAGSSIGATLGSGVVVTSGAYASHFRSGVMRFTVATVAGLAAAGNVLTQSDLSPQLDPAATYYEGSHRYCRLSEHLVWKPMGCLPTSLAATPDGGFVVSHTNQGWGPNGNPANAHYRAPNGTAGYYTIAKFSSAGALEWQIDTASILEAGAGGFLNDIPVGAADDPSIHALAVADDGIIYAAGRRNLAGAGGVCAFCFDQDGQLIWQQDLGGTVREGGIVVPPVGTSSSSGTTFRNTGAPIFVGDRNSAWPAATGNAHLWELRTGDGGISRTFDLGAAVSALGVAAIPGKVFYVTDKV